MSDGSKPPLPRPGLVQKPGGDGRPRAPPPPPPQSLKGSTSKPPSSPPPFVKRDVLPSVSPIPPKPQPIISKTPQAPAPQEKSPAGGAPIKIESNSDSSGPNRLPTPGSGVAPLQPKKPTREDTMTLRRTGSNPQIVVPGAKPPFNGEAPLAEPPSQSKPAPQAATPSAPAPRTERISEMPIEVEVDLGGFEEEGEPTAQIQAPQKPVAIPNFGAIDSKAKLALETAFRIFPEKRGKSVELKETKLLIGGKECGEFSMVKNSGHTLSINLEKLGLSNAHIAMDDEILSRISSLFNTISEKFLVQALEKNDYAEISANSAGIRLVFCKHASGSSNSSFPLRTGGEDNK